MSATTYVIFYLNLLPLFLLKLIYINRKGHMTTTNEMLVLLTIKKVIAKTNKMYPDIPTFYPGTVRNLIVFPWLKRKISL